MKAVPNPKLLAKPFADPSTPILVRTKKSPSPTLNLFTFQAISYALCGIGMSPTPVRRSRNSSTWPICHTPGAVRTLPSIRCLSVRCESMPKPYPGAFLSSTSWALNVEKHPVFCRFSRTSFACTLSRSARSPLSERTVKETIIPRSGLPRPESLFFVVSMPTGRAATANGALRAISLPPCTATRDSWLTWRERVCAVPLTVTVPDAVRSALGFPSISTSPGSAPPA